MVFYVTLNDMSWRHIDLNSKTKQQTFYIYFSHNTFSLWNKLAFGPKGVAREFLDTNEILLDENEVNTIFEIKQITLEVIKTLRFQ